MKAFASDSVKNLWLRQLRGVSFAEVLLHIEAGYLLDVLEHPNPELYPRRKIFVILIDPYVHLVPFVCSDEEVSRKTTILRRKATRALRAIHD